jgi:hypothetical protein
MAKRVELIKMDPTVGALDKNIPIHSAILDSYDRALL